MNTFQINSTIIFIILFLNYLNYINIYNEKYLPLCLDKLDLISIAIVIIFAIISYMVGLFDYIKETTISIYVTFLRFIFLATLLSSFHIYSLKLINYIYC